MNINPTIQAIGTAMSIPAYPDEMVPLSNSGEYPSKYIAYLYSDERPIVRGSNEDIVEAATIQVHFFTKSSPIEDKETLKAKLRQEGFVILNTSQYHEDDTGYTHLIITVWAWDVVTVPTEPPEEINQEEENNG